MQINSSKIPFKYLQKEVDQVYFLLADKYQCFVQVYTNNWVFIPRYTQGTQDNKLKRSE